MNGRAHIRLLRISYWIGAVFDALMIIPMVSPRAAQATLGLPNFTPGPEYRYAMFIGASLMAGWTCLLVWADRKPVERKGIVLFTMVPVLAGLMISGVYAVRSHVVPMGRMIPLWIAQAVLMLLFAAGYRQASRG